MSETKRMWIVAGPPGAGKSGLTRNLFPDWIGTSRHVDADDTLGFEDADDLEPGLYRHIVPVSKRLEIAEVGARDFVVETRMVSRKPLSAAIRLRRHGWQVSLIYLALPRIDLCRRRVRARVARGGDDVDAEIMERAFTASLENLPRYIDAAERWLILDSSGARKPLIARGSHAAAVAAQDDALRGLLPDYPFLPASADVRNDPWADPVEAAFAKLARWQTTLDRLIGLAQAMEDRRAP